MITATKFREYAVKVQCGFELTDEELDLLYDELVGDMPYSIANGGVYHIEWIYNYLDDYYLNAPDLVLSCNAEENNLDKVIH